MERNPHRHRRCVSTFNFVAADGSLQGLDVEIANALCKAMDAKCTIVANDWDGMIPGLKSNKFDAVIASMSVTEERKKEVAFTDKYYSTPLSVAVPKDSPITSLDAEAFKGKSVGAQGSTTQGNYAEDVYGKAGADVKLYPTADEANADLKTGALMRLFPTNFRSLTGSKVTVRIVASLSAIFPARRLIPELRFVRAMTICASSSMRQSRKFATMEPMPRS